MTDMFTPVKYSGDGVKMVTSFDCLIENKHF